jgi:FMN phosphatase YigB (HAD superfamily)
VLPARLGASAAGNVMVGDDIETDVLAAQRQGSPGCWSRPASTFRARTAPQPAAPTMSWTPPPPAALLEQQS